MMINGVCDMIGRGVKISRLYEEGWYITTDPWLERSNLKCSGAEGCDCLPHKIAVFGQKLSEWHFFFLDLGHGENEDDLTPWRVIAIKGLDWWK